MTETQNNDKACVIERECGRDNLTQSDLAASLDSIQNLESELVVSRMALEAMLQHVSLAEKKLAALTAEQETMCERLAQTEAELQCARVREDMAEQKALIAQSQNAEMSRRTGEIGAGLKELLQAISMPKMICIGYQED
jgi:chromosome segregation ATPase